LKNPSSLAKGASLTSVATAALLLLHTGGASALSLGRLTVQSSLGEALRAEIDITSMTPDEASSLRTTLASPEAFRAAGVDFNPVLSGAQLQLARRPDGRSYIKVTGERAVSEPFVDVIIDFTWASGRLQRAYTLLIDPPIRPSAPAPAAATTAPAMSPAPVQTTPIAPAPSTPRATRPSAPPPAPKPMAPPPPSPPPSSASEGGDTYKVRAGDTLSSIASNHPRSGVSLDQMLVSLYRGNPQAFIDSNMNRLKSGVVLNVPDSASAKDVAPDEARKVIQAHSADFATFRQRLAGAAPTIKGSEPERQATGQVQAAVKDRKTDTGATPPDRLTLSQGSAKPGAEATLSKEAEKKAKDTRVAELSRNVQELNKLAADTKAASKPAAPTPAAVAPVATPAPAKPGVQVPVAQAPAPTPAKTVAPPPPAPPPPAPAPAKVVAPPPPAPAATPTPAVVAPPPAPVPAVTASAPAIDMPSAASVPEAAASPVPAPKPAPKKKVAPPPPVPEPSFFDSLTSNPWVLPGAAGLVALLAGLGVMRLRRRQQDGAAETSFIESKLQPDSFFGVSGGQRVDTRDGANSSSSLSYSLSQLDAIGDVDPVAEADVYLAYGRDLQAEEILKEALRSDPGRVAIRSKLLEVYAKRADTKAFDAQARQLLEQTGGVGDEWEKATELGRGIDPANPLYGGAGAVVQVDIDTSTEPPPDLREDFHPSTRGESPVEKTQPFTGEVLLDTAPGDLDIDLGSPSSVAGLESTRPLETASGGLDLGAGDLRDMRSSPPKAPAPAAKAPLEPEDSILDLPMIDLPEGETDGDSVQPTAPSSFDFGELSLDLGETKEEESTVRGGLQAEEIDESDPLARKLELADEFRRIGDMEGARDLLEEVVNKADGALRSRAQAMLDELE
jgi:pilus assembly protein FimV